MTENLESRIIQLEKDVTNLKKLATLQHELNDLKIQTPDASKAKRLSGLTIFLILLAVIVAGFVTIMPILTEIVTLKFDAIRTGIEQ